MFNFFAEVLELLYRLWSSYGVTIILLTIGIRLLVTPLTVKGTKSMLEMRKVQPEIKKLQAQYKNDRYRMNQELSQLYKEHKINPLGGCLPLLVQLPIFLVLYQVIRGLTRRASDVGYALGKMSGLLQTNASAEALSQASLSSETKRNFNPDWLDTSDQMYLDLSEDNEMVSWGLDLAITPWQILTDDVIRALPYLGLILLTGILSYVQQRQIQGRSTTDINPQQRILMRIIPIFIPIISFNLPTALVVYFLTTSAVGVAQQWFLTRWVYAPHHGRQAEQESSGSEVIDITPSDTAPEQQEKPKGILGSLGGQPPEQKRHGTSPLSKPPKALPPKAGQKKTLPPPPPPAANNKSTESQPKTRRDKKSRNENPEPERKVSKRVTPKKNPNEQLRKRRRHR